MKPKNAIILVLSSIVLVWSFFPLLLQIINPSNSLNELAQLGDSYGAINSLFSGLALAGIVISIYMQSQDLKLNREELKLTRAELALTRDEIKGQTEQLEAQADSMKVQNEQILKQSFESTFFQMLGLHNEIVDSLSVVQQATLFSGRGNEMCRGREAFHGLFEMYIERKKAEDKMYNKEKIEDFEFYYKDFYDNHSGEIGHYFRNIYIILKFVDSGDVADKKFYTNILRAQLSTYELALLLLNCYSEHGKEKHKPLIEKYALFEHLPFMDFPYNEIYQLYEREAFGKTNTSVFNELDGVVFDKLPEITTNS